MQYFLHTWVYELRAIPVIKSILKNTCAGLHTQRTWESWEMMWKSKVMSGSLERLQGDRILRDVQSEKKAFREEWMVHEVGLRQKKWGEGHWTNLHILDLFGCSHEADTCEKSLMQSLILCLSTESWELSLCLSPLFFTLTLCFMHLHFFCQGSVQLVI